MEFTDKAKAHEIQEEFGPKSLSNDYDYNGEIHICIQNSQEGNMNDINQTNKAFDTASNISPKFVCMKSGSPSISLSPSAVFYQIAHERDDFSQSVASPTGQTSQMHFNMPFLGKISWISIKAMSKEWIRNPHNLALFAWIVCVAISGALLFMVMTGMLNHALPRKSQRDAWFEVNNQILNALFTLMCLYQHPRRFHHLALLCRWRAEDVLTLRKIYCKGGSYKPHEWMHMMVVVVLLHINCFAQYAMCGLNLGYPRSRRPALGVGLCISVAIVAPVIATVYNILSPLGKEYDYGTEQEEAQSKVSFVSDSGANQVNPNSVENKYSYVARAGEREAAENKPKWAGGLFDLWDDISLAYLSIFCCFCVFGWNMDRLGFGNMYVHIATFILLCMAPFWIFNLAAVNINNEAIRQALGLAGVILCILGLLYGGFWRIQMRKKFNLPAVDFCCGNASVTDCFVWLCCCTCSLAQEVRTADAYDIMENRFCTKHDAHGNSPPAMSPLSREDGLPLFRSGPSSPLWGNWSPSYYNSYGKRSPSIFLKHHGEDVRHPVVMEESSTRGMDVNMSPPLPSLIQR